AGASEAAIGPKVAGPVRSYRDGAMLGTVRSWIIHPSYQPLSLLMTNSGSMSVKTSMKVRGLLGSVGRPGFGSRTTRTVPIVGSPQLAPVTDSCTASLTPGIRVVNTFGSNPAVSRR